MEFPEFLEGFKERHRSWFGGVQSYVRPPETPAIGPVVRQEATVESISVKERAIFTKEPLDAKARASGEVEERETPEDFENE